MKIVRLFMPAVFVLAAAMVSRAQTVDEIINKHIDAIGGKDMLSRITSLHMESSVNAMGNDNPSNVTILNGKGFKMEAEFNGQKIVNVYTDTSGWMINPMAGASDAVALPAEQYNVGKNSIYAGGPLFDYAAKGNKVELQGTEKVGNVDAYKIKLTTPANVALTYWIDPSTYYILKFSSILTMMGQDMEVSNTYSDYRKTDFGYVTPYTIEIDYGGQFSLTSTLKKIEFNVPVDPAIFSMPK